MSIQIDSRLTDITDEPFGATLPPRLGVREDFSNGGYGVTFSGGGDDGSNPSIALIPNDP